ncbi:ADP-ribose pyrophosphatase [Salinarchaeum sp. Harcht-Bsk1]|uniref:NUDIX domain-containing protein n=1 Tax=Salinarchaeum sp. Harcht-Bsk1 TaxID=1333523 RepID=UPI0003423945|nr:NUDIX domain-containing protein [Salinarchaeum sp. Harcht-Bsk1]AGN02255.1 ADP-ribose pyrophosphatase [Salinarchaeum sp. Harcht-Bsk1]
MSNFPPEYCPYCGSELDEVEPPTSHYCGRCEDYVFYNPTPGGSVAVVDGDRLLLVEDFRYENEWKLPSGVLESGESPAEGAIRELAEETGLSVAPSDLAYVTNNAVEPVEGKHHANVTFAARRAATTGTVEAGSDATDARFWSPVEFADAEARFTDVHRRRFGSDSLAWLHETVESALVESE